MKKKMLIYINSMNYFGGIERVEANLTSEFIKEREVTILVKDSPTSVYTLSNKVKLESIQNELIFNMNSRFKRIIDVGINFITSTIKLRKYLTKNHYDIIVITTPLNCLEMYCASVKDRKHLIATEHASYFAYNKIYQIIKNYIYSKINAISVPTKMDTDIYISKGYKAYYIPHTSTFIPEEKITSNKNKVINIGRLTNDKQQILLLKIWKEVNNRIPNNKYILQIIGSGENKELLENYILENKLINVELIPQTTSIDQYYKNAELFLLTSKMEGFGMVLLEAMSFGVPCISFNCPSGPADIIKEDYNGYLIECFNISAYIEKVCFFLQSVDKEKMRLKQNALNTVQNWDNYNILEKWEVLFERIENI